MVKKKKNKYGQYNARIKSHFQGQSCDMPRVVLFFGVHDRELVLSCYYNGEHSNNHGVLFKKCKIFYYI